MAQKIFALLYCRVSSKKQAAEGHGLSSQQTRLQLYAESKGYEVLRTYNEEAKSGKLFDRPEIHEMLAFLKANKKKGQYVVLIDDISRLARDVEVHIKLRAALREVGARLESPTMDFGDDADRTLVEFFLASVAQHHRMKNTEVVINRTRARLQNGYYTSYPPRGYKYQKVEGHGKLLVPIQPMASYLQEALKGFASGRFGSQAEVVRFLSSKEGFIKYKDGQIHPERVAALLRNPIYAGYISIPSMGVHLQLGKHEPLISFDEFQKIQQKLNGIAHAPARKDISQLFPLRNFILCEACLKPMSTTMSKGKYRYYPYYLCHHKGCVYYGKSIRQHRVDEDFEKLLSTLTPRPEILRVAKAALLDGLKDRKKDYQGEVLSLTDSITQVDKKVKQLVDRLVEADDPAVIAAYESKIKELQSEKVRLREKLNSHGATLPNVDEILRTSFEFLTDPQKLWNSEDLEDKRTLLKLVFKANLPWSRDGGFRTPEFSLPFMMLRGVSTSQKEMVEAAGFEPASVSTQPSALHV